MNYQLFLIEWTGITQIGLQNGETVGADPDVSMILVSTLDGRLRALDVATGKEKWEMQEG